MDWILGVSKMSVKSVVIVSCILCGILQVPLFLPRSDAQDGTEIYVAFATNIASVFLIFCVWWILEKGSEGKVEEVDGFTQSCFPTLSFQGETKNSDGNCDCCCDAIKNKKASLSNGDYADSGDESYLLDQGIRRTSYKVCGCQRSKVTGNGEGQELPHEYEDSEFEVEEDLQASIEEILKHL